MIIVLAWFGRDGVRKCIVLTAVRLHEHRSLIAQEGANDQSSFAMKIVMKNCSIATIPHEWEKNRMFNRKWDCNEQLHVWQQQRSWQAISWMSTLMSATINHVAFQIMKDRLSQSGTTLGTCGVFFDEKNSNVWRKKSWRVQQCRTLNNQSDWFFIFKTVVCDT